MDALAGEAQPARIITIESLEQEARGVGHWMGKTIFVDGALPGETIEFSPYRRKPAYEFARPTRWLRTSPQRVAPRCPHFGVCGGCSLQHFEAAAQVAAKQRILEDALWHVGRVRANQILPALHGPAWEYRQRARLTVRNVPKKGGILVGFHERRSSFVADMTSCVVLPQRISMLLPKMRELVASLSVRERLPQIEVSCGDDIDVLVLRILVSLTREDEERIRRFADEHSVVIYLQPDGPDSVRLFHPVDSPELSYRIPSFDLELAFGPTDFTQVNAAVNRVLVARAMRLLAPQPGDRVADLFCGLGNFSLAIARSGANVIGFEGVAGLVQRATDNARRNRLDHQCAFFRADLFKDADAVIAQHGPFDLALIDPPRTGAMEIVKAWADPLPRRIVYVSCNPATLARDAAVLAQVKGYEFSAAGVVNMFPHTAHVESIAVFDRA